MMCAFLVYNLSLKASTVGTRFYKQTYRKLHVTKALSLNPSNVTEVRIPVPWGHVAGKWWGSTQEQPVLALHGWQDNACSFDHLLELLPDSQPVLAIDSPGHGFSSHLPKGFVYHNGIYVMTCRQIQKYFKWDKKITIIAHSEGAVTGFLLSAIYPEIVHALVALDTIKPQAPGHSQTSNLGKTMDLRITKSGRDSSTNKKYSLEEIEKLCMNNPTGSLPSEAVRTLMKRGVQLDQESGKYCLTRDPKLKAPSLQRFDENQILGLAKNLKCNYLALRFGKIFDKNIRNSPNFINTVTEVAKSFEIVVVEGSHHNHLVNPKSVAPVIIDFMKKIDCN